CEVALPPDRYPMVSREHAFLTIENERIRLSDNQSTNGTYVNGIAISNAMLTKLDHFSLGKDGTEFEIHIVEEQPSANAPAVLSAKAATAAVEARDPANIPTRIATRVEQEKQLTGQTVVQKVEAKPAEGASRGGAPLVDEEATASLLSQED